jgi:hypothetical protein
MDEQATPQRMIFLKSGESLSVEGLARKLRGAVFEILQDDIPTDEDSAITALAAFDASENFTGTMSKEELESFVDEFCEAWKTDSP